VTALARQIELAYDIRVIAEDDEQMLHCLVCGRRDDDVEQEYWHEYSPPLTPDDFCDGGCGEPERNRPMPREERDAIVRADEFKALHWHLAINGKVPSANSVEADFDAFESATPAEQEALLTMLRNTLR
jgi:hypothetical protein